MGTGVGSAPKKPVTSMTLPSAYLQIKPREISLSQDKVKDYWSDDQEIDTQEIPHDACRTLKYTGGRRAIARAIASIVREDPTTPTGKIPLIDPGATARLSADELAVVESSQTLRDLPAVGDDQVMRTAKRRAAAVRRLSGLGLFGAVALLLGGVVASSVLLYSAARAPLLTALGMQQLDGFLPEPLDEVVLSAAMILPTKVDSEGEAETTVSETVANSSPAEPELASTSNASAVEVSQEAPSTVEPRNESAGEPRPAEAQVEDQPTDSSSVEGQPLEELPAEEVEAAGDSASSEELGEMLLPLRFEPGRSTPRSVDREELRQLARLMIADRSLRFSFVGFTRSDEAASALRRRRIAARRANVAMDLIRSFGPSRRRLESRPARSDESVPELADGEEDRLVLLRVH